MGGHYDSFGIHGNFSLTGGHQKHIKKPPGMPAVFEESGRFIWVRSKLSTAAGA
jgi:hypothetical protein